MTDTTREEAHAKLAELTVAVNQALTKAEELCREHNLTFELEREGAAYTRHLTIDRWGAMETWETSNWEDSGC